MKKITLIIVFFSATKTGWAQIQTFSLSELRNSISNNFEKLTFNNNTQAQAIAFKISDSLKSSTSRLIDQFYSNSLVPYFQIESFKNDISKSISIILSYSSTSLIDEAINTSCDNIQSMILQNMVDQWKYILTQQKRVNNVSPAFTIRSGNAVSELNGNTRIIDEKLEDFTNRIEILKIATHITSSELVINFSDRNTRIEFLKRIKNSSQLFVDLDINIKKL